MRTAARPRTDVDPPRFLDRTAIGGGISSRRPRGDTLIGIAPDLSIVFLFISGITGLVSIDANGDRNADYSLLDMNTSSGEFEVCRTASLH